MEYIRVTKDNLKKEHICCAISNKYLKILLIIGIVMFLLGTLLTWIGFVQQFIL